MCPLSSKKQGLQMPEVHEKGQTKLEINAWLLSLTVFSSVMFAQHTNKFSYLKRAF